MNKKILVILFFLILTSIGTVSAFDVPPLSEGILMPEAKGTGTHFKIENSDYLNISLTSSVPISILLKSAGTMIEYDLKHSINNATTTITLIGLEPSTKYYMYEDSYRNLTTFTTDFKGSYTYNQDLSKSHHKWIQPRPSTYFIADNSTGEDCEGRSIGIWNSNTKTCTLTTNLNESVEIESNNITLDCDNHNIIGSGTGYGIYVPQRNGTTIEACNVNNFHIGIKYSTSINSTILNNTTTSNYFGMSLVDFNNSMVLDNTGNSEQYGIYLGYSTNSTILNNNADSNYSGFYIYYSNENTLADNATDSNVVGFHLHRSNKNILTDNNATSKLDGISLSNSNKNILTGNIMPSNNRYGINLGSSNDNILVGNITKSNTVYGISLLYSNNNLIVDNNINNMLVLSASSDNNIFYNEFFGSQGLYIQSGPNENNQINHNNINTTSWKVLNFQTQDINVENNWWGTTDANEIAEKIYDYYDYDGYGIVDFTPWQETPINNNFSLEITSPASGSTFNPNEAMGVQFEIKDKDNYPTLGITQIDYKLKNPDSWTTTSVNNVSVGVYDFSVQAPSEEDDYTLSVKADINGSIIIDSIGYFVDSLDLYIDSIKPVQVVEDVNLVSGKATVVRVKVINTGNPVTVKTKLTYDGQNYYKTQIINQSEIIDFYPEPYSTYGTYQVSGEVDTNNAVLESNESNNTKTVDVNVIDTRPLDVVFRPIEWEILDFDGFIETQIKNTEFLQATYPINEDELNISINYIPHILSPGEWVPLFGISILLQNLYIEQVLSGDFDVDRVVGIVPEQVMDIITLGGAGGMSSMLNPFAVLITPNITHVTAHEVGHTYFLCDEYNYCVWSAQNSMRSLMGGCPNPFPYECDPEHCSDCTSLGEDDINGFWVDLKEERKSDPNKGIPKFFSFMGNSDSLEVRCDSESRTCRWVSKESYSHLLWDFSIPHTDVNEVFLVSGLVDKNFNIELNEFYITTGVIENVPSGDYSIELVDINGQVLSETDFNVSFYFTSNPPIDLNETFFAFTIPYDADTNKIVVKYNGGVKAERHLSANAPTVDINSPSGGETWSGTHTIAWTAFDADNDELTYVIQYSDNNGGTWQNLTLDYNQTSYSWGAEQVLPSNNYKVKVIATDGVLTGEDDSNLFTVQNPDISVTPYNWGFGYVAQGSIITQDFNVANTGNADLDISEINSSSDINISGITLPLTLSQGESQAFTATIDTLNILGGYSGDINISSNDPNENPKVISVDGNVQEITPQISIDVSAPNEVNYPNPFLLNAIVTTQNAPLRDANITITLPDGLSTNDDLTIDLNNVFESDEKDANWNIDVNQVGLFEIVLTVSSINASDVNEYKQISVTTLGLSSVSMDKNGYLPNEVVIIDSNVTNFNPSVSYTNLDLNIVITNPQDNNTYLHTDINALYADTTQTVTTVWTEESKAIGTHQVTAYLYASNGELLDSNSTTFEVLLPPIHWILGYGGKTVQDYNLTYTLLPQPTGKLIGEDYNILIGWND